MKLGSVDVACPACARPIAVSLRARLMPHVAGGNVPLQVETTDAEERMGEHVTQCHSGGPGDGGEPLPVAI